MLAIRHRLVCHTLDPRLSQSPSVAVGQVSADGQFRWDGQQWVPIPGGERESTPWTRPMQLITAALLALEAVLTVAATVIFYTHDAVKKTIEAAGTQIPAGTTEDQLIAITIGFAIGFVVFLAVVELFGALGAFLRWRWAFWYVLVLFGLGSLSAIVGVVGLFRPSNTPFPLGYEVVSEVLGLVAVATFVWMLIGAIRYGPWAMKRPGS